MATSPKTTSKPRPKRSRMDNAQNSVLVKLMERVDQLSAIVSHQVHAGKPADDGPRQDQNFAAVPRSNPPSPPNRSIPDSIERLRGAVQALRDYKNLHAEVYAPVIMPASANTTVGPVQVNQLSNCEVSSILNDLADSVLVITADLKDMLSRTQL